ncbi:MAG: OmpA family protein [Pseudonocardiaceae bacterium]|nr:OmpA family protein [Pseudonocardiaceae bacterium]
MHPAARLASGAVTLVVGLLLLTGCGGDQASGPGALALVVGAHANMVEPSMVDAVQAEIETAAELGSTTTVIVADGTPTASRSLSLEAENPLYQQDRIAQLGTMVREARADSPEVDLLGAIGLAARAVTDAAGPKTLVVIDSGLQTTGALRFQDRDGALFDADPAEVSDHLARTGQLPDLRGMRVVFVGLGDTAPPQQSLPQLRRAALLDLWRGIVEKAGAEVEIREAPLPDTRELDGLPPVTTVPVAVDVAGPAEQITVLRNSTVGFLPDQAVFRDPDQARAVVDEIAAAIKNGQRAVLTGTTAKAGTPEGRAELSLQRANAVADLLVGLGAPAERIETRGVGSDFPGYVPDHDAQGNLDPIRAAQNRQVIVELFD